MQPDILSTLQPRRPGPVPRLNTVSTTIQLEPDLLAWGKQQPGGLSATIRDLLRHAMNQETTPRH